MVNKESTLKDLVKRVIKQKKYIYFVNLSCYSEYTAYKTIFD